MRKYAKKEKDLSNGVIYFIYGLYIFLISVIIASVYITRKIHGIHKINVSYFLWSVFIGISVIFLIILFGNRIFDRFEKINSKTSLYILLVLCFLVKLVFVLFYRIKPMGDYGVFYQTAKKLSEYNVINDSCYIALFPHLFGYSVFLSGFFKIFGSGFLVAPIVNAVLSVVSMALIYYICLNLISKAGAVIASIIWILFPSQTIYNIYVLSEPLYTMGLLGFFALIVFLNKKIGNKSMKWVIFFGIIIAVVLQGINMVRPISAIPIIAFLIWVFFVNLKKFRARHVLKKYITVLLTVVVAYSALLCLSNWYIETRLGEAPAPIPGYNICVGFNMDSFGRWNKQDSQLLYFYNDHPGWTAVQAQNQMLEEAKKRIFTEDIDFISLFFHKFLVLWGNDNASVKYGLDIASHPTFSCIISNAFYYIILICSIAGAVFAIKNKDKSVLFVICIYMIGLNFAHMFVEVASRYHYSGIITFTIMATYGIIESHNVLKNRRKSSSTNIIG